MPQRSALVIEDDVGIRTLVTHLLERAKVHVKTAEDGAKALELVRQHPFEVIVLDLMMPTMNGFDFLDTLRAERPELVAKVIVVTARTDRGEAPVCDGVFTMLRKPFDITELLNAAERCLAKTSERLQESLKPI